jgi:hypothetical protein
VATFDHRFLGAAIEREIGVLKLERVVGAVRRAVHLHGPRLAQALVDAENPPPVDRGTYRRQFVTEDVRGGAAMYNSSPHGPIVEDGRRAGARMPPPDVLADWVRRKGIGRVYGPLGRGQRRRPSKQQARALAFVIARAIARRGLRGHHILARVEERLWPLVIREVDEELAK